MFKKTQVVVKFALTKEIPIFNCCLQNDMFVFKENKITAENGLMFTIYSYKYILPYIFVENIILISTVY